jgi:endonuclease/exonuclease/phosphatase family metal-dependent hydrolase
MRFSVHCLSWLAVAWLAAIGDAPAKAPSPYVEITIASANLSDGTTQHYEEPGIRLLQTLNPDVVGMQEFTYAFGSPEELVESIFGEGRHFVRETGARLPNGIVSRFPIVAHGQWEDPNVSNRNFAWATVQIPGAKPLHVVSAHLLHNRSGRRIEQAQLLVDRVREHFPRGDYVVLCADLNVPSRNAETLFILREEFMDDPQPADQEGNKNTNSTRSRPYDFVMPNLELSRVEVPTRLGGLEFPGGLVFDTRLWSPPPPPAEWEDSARNLQHMPVMRTFRIPVEPATHPAASLRNEPDAIRESP